MTSSSPGPAILQIEHSGDGTLVYGSDRADTEGNAALKAANFKWSKNLGAWYLPRPWAFNTRTLKVRQLMSRLPDRTELSEGTAARSTTAVERQEAAREGSANRAERLTSAAERAAAEASSRFATADRLGERFAGGQPILVGHHSEAGARRDQSRMHNNMRAGIAAQDKASRLEDAAATANTRATQSESPVTIGNRVARLEAELRDIERKLSGYKNNRNDVFGPATGSYQEQLVIRQAEATDELTLNRENYQAALAEKGRIEYGPHNVNKDDVVVVRGRPHVVDRANKATVSVKTEYSWTDKVPYREITRVVPAAEVAAARAALASREAAAADSASESVAVLQEPDAQTMPELWDEPEIQDGANPKQDVKPEPEPEPGLGTISNPETGPEATPALEVAEPEPEPEPEATPGVSPSEPEPTPQGAPRSNVLVMVEPAPRTRSKSPRSIGRKPPAGHPALELLFDGPSPVASLDQPEPGSEPPPPARDLDPFDRIKGEDGRMGTVLTSAWVMSAPGVVELHVAWQNEGSTFPSVELHLWPDNMPVERLNDKSERCPRWFAQSQRLKAGAPVVIAQTNSESGPKLNGCRAIVVSVDEASENRSYSVRPLMELTGAQSEVGEVKLSECELVPSNFCKEGNTPGTLQLLSRPLKAAAVESLS